MERLRWIVKQVSQPMKCGFTSPYGYFFTLYDFVERFGTSQTTLRNDLTRMRGLFGISLGLTMPIALVPAGLDRKWMIKSAVPSIKVVLPVYYSGEIIEWERYSIVRRDMVVSRYGETRFVWKSSFLWPVPENAIVWSSCETRRSPPAPTTLPWTVQELVDPANDPFKWSRSMMGQVSERKKVFSP